MPIKRYRTGEHPYFHYGHKPVKKSQKKTATFVSIFIVSIFFICSGVTLSLLSQPVPQVHAQEIYKDKQIAEPIVAWPSTSQASFGTTTEGLLAEKPGQQAHPTASTAKLITALVVLRKKPLKIGEQGPMITLQKNDVLNQQQYAVHGGSTIAVSEGEKISQYQLLQGILLPSANNYADTLAVWAFGSLAEYQKSAQKYVSSIGAKQTTIGSDASGFSPSTTSTASDLVRVGIAAAHQPVMMDIMKQESAIFPVAGERFSTNRLLGSEGIIGGKTGNTDEAGGVYIFISKYSFQKQDIFIVGAVQGERTVPEAMAQAKGLLAQVRPHFKMVTIAEKNDTVALYKTPWGSMARAVLMNSVKFVGWSGREVTRTVALSDVSIPARQGAVVGKMRVDGRESSIILRDAIVGPTWQWKILSKL